MSSRDADLRPDLRLAQERLDAYLRYASQGIWMFEAAPPIPVTLPVPDQVELMLQRGVLRECNQRMADMYGVASAADLLGRTAMEFLGDSPANRAYLAAFAGSGYRLLDADSEERDREGKLHVFSNSLTGVVEEGLLVRVWGTQIDVTSLRETERRLEIALAASELGTWDYDPQTGVTRWDDRYRAILGSGDDAADYRIFLDSILPEDRPAVEAAVARSLDPGGDGRFLVEYRLRSADRTLWIQGQGRAYFEGGRAVRFIGTVRDVTADRAQRDRLESLARENARLLEEARQALAAREEFLSIASHELRTPLTALHVRLARVESGAVPADAGFLRFARRQVTRLSRLVGELVDVTRIEAGQLALAPTDLDLAVVAAEAAEELAEEASRAGTRIDVEGEPARVRGDPDLLARAVENLLANAVKYGGGRPVRVRVDTRDGQGRIHVHDDGIGIPPAEQSRIFERFARAEPARHYGGLGLGLFIVRRIAQAHGGDVEVDSAPELGTTFVLRVPLRG